jgi:integrase
MKQATMVTRVNAYLCVRRQFGYLLRVEGGELLRFARYADGLGHRGPVTTELALRCAQDAGTATPLYRARRLEIVRCFAKHQAGIEPGTEIPLKGILGPAHRRMQPYVFSSAEIALLIAAAIRLRSRRGLRAQTYASIAGLLACTGLRISEALRLQRSDLDLRQGLLVIRQTKFGKSRLVPLHASTQAALRRYLIRRDRIVPRLADAKLFVCEAGRALPYSTVRTVFRKLIDEAVGREVRHHRRPRIHDLRHTFACRCLLRCYGQRSDIDKCVAALSTYLGHVKISDTYWYLTGVPELMAIAGARFQRFGREGSAHVSRS